jgi:hypothetical protein
MKPVHRRWVRASDQVVELARTGLTLDREVADIGKIFYPDEVAARASDIPTAQCPQSSKPMKLWGAPQAG